MRALDFIEQHIDRRHRWFRQRAIALCHHRFFPYEPLHDLIVESCAESLDKNDNKRFWELWKLNFKCSIDDYYVYPSMDAQWVSRHVLIPKPQILDTLRDSGGLVLTYHFHHQNSLCCVLGELGLKVWAIANRPESSPLFPYIGNWARRLNSLTRQHFQGGEYLYTDDLRSIALALPGIFQARNALICLVDVHQPSPRSPRTRIFNREIQAPIGVIESALRAQSAIYLAYLTPNLGARQHHSGEFAYELAIELIEQQESSSVLDVYFSRLETLLTSQPHLWQGWQWLGNLPLEAN